MACAAGSRFQFPPYKAHIVLLSIVTTHSACSPHRKGRLGSPELGAAHWLVQLHKEGPVEERPAGPEVHLSGWVIGLCMLRVVVRKPDAVSAVNEVAAESRASGQMRISEKQQDGGVRMSLHYGG
ncbi:hypothetical protein R6Z07F_012346 [Ovis aries]